MVRLLATFVIVGALSVSVPANAETTTLKIATLAPAESPWGQIFKVWKRGVEERSNGTLELQFYWSGQQGDEAAVIGKIRTGQIDGATVTAVGLSQIHRNVLVLQLPGLFREWAKLDAARASMRPQFDAEFEKQGFRVLGWGDVGRAHTMTKGFMLRTPKDLKHRNVMVMPGDPIAPLIYATVGDVTPKQLGITEILPALMSGTLDVLTVPALAAEQLQWSPRLDHINTMVSGIGIGALIFSAPKMRSLPADVLAVLADTGKIAGEALTKRVRAEDDAAFERLKKRMTPYDLDAAEQGEWAKLFTEVATKLRGTTFNAQVFDEAVKLAR
jgi:TRAP-type C4-dicarboxylate transport system substrate-binding protein